MGAQSSVLRKVDVRVVPMDECNHMYSHVKVENPTQICTYATRKASCQVKHFSYPFNNIVGITDTFIEGCHMS